MYLFGHDAYGKSFREIVCTLDLCKQGARISQVRRNLSVSQEVAVQYSKYKVRFRVAWLGEYPREGQVGLRAIDSLEKISDLSEIFTADYIDTWNPALEQPTIK